MQNQRIMLTRRRLKEALLRLLESAPLDKISVTQLCQEAGVNRATFYRHYTSQEDVLLEIQQDTLDNIQSLLGRFDVWGRISPWDQTFLICKYLWEHPREARLFLSNSDIGSDFAEKLFQCVKGRRLLECYFDPSMDAAHRELVTAFWQNGFLSVLRKWLVDGVPLKPEDVAELILQIAQRSLDAEKHPS